jgi:carbon storage regulator
LELTRRIGEKVYIGPDIALVVLSIDGGRVCLGVDAPRELPVWRGELLEPRARLPSPLGARPIPKAYLRAG